MDSNKTFSNSFGPASIVIQSPNLVAAAIDEVTAIMSTEKSVYFLIDATGSVIWSRISKPTRISDLCSALISEYEVDPKTCENDVLEFIGDLLTRELARLEG